MDVLVEWLLFWEKKENVEVDFVNCKINSNEKTTRKLCVRGLFLCFSDGWNNWNYVERVTFLQISCGSRSCDGSSVEAVVYIGSDTCFFENLIVRAF